MTRKTAAELQIEFLKKLKQSSQPPAPGAKKAPVKNKAGNTPRAIPQSVENVSRVPQKPLSGLELTQISARRRKSSKGASRITMPATKVDKNIFKRVKDKNKRLKIFKGSGPMLDWALELISELPYSASTLSREGKADFFKQANQWLAQRGVKDA